jgi:hypothetical protein
VKDRAVHQALRGALLAAGCAVKPWGEISVSASALNWLEEWLWSANVVNAVLDHGDRHVEEIEIYVVDSQGHSVFLLLMV